MMSKNFKSSLLKSMGDGVSTLCSQCPNGSRITTYSLQVEENFINNQNIVPTSSVVDKSDENEKSVCPPRRKVN